MMWVQCELAIETMHWNYMIWSSIFSVFPIFSESGLSNFIMLSDLNRTVVGKKFSDGEEEVAETEAYYEAKGKSYYEKGIKKL